MKRYFAISLACAFMMSLTLAPTYAEDTKTAQFFHAVPDLPLMTGLREADDLTLVFDKPEGRVVEVIATSTTLQATNVQHFYDTVLPQMGWTRAGVNHFMRDKEFLHITFDSDPEQLVIRVSITPKTMPQ